MSAELVLSTIIFIGLAVAIPTIMVLMVYLGPRSTVEAKDDPYESGVKHVVGMADQKFSVKFYLMAILFLIFDIEAVFKAIDEKFGRIDILINNGATNPYYGPMTETPVEAFDKTFDVNVKGPFMMTAAALAMLLLTSRAPWTWLRMNLSTNSM